MTSMTLRYVCALRNREAGGGIAAELYYTDPSKADEFTARWNKPGIGVYDCIGTLKDGAKTRCKETIAELDRVICDLDLKNIAQSRAEIIDAVKSLLLEPSEIRDSGNGLHIIWLLKEPVNDEAGLAEAEAIMKRLVTLLAGDPAPTHRAALLRRLGSLNTKGGGSKLCHVIENSGKPYDISEFADMFNLYGQPLLTLKPRDEPAAQAHDAADTDPVDVEARLAAIAYQGSGNTSIHTTWKDCMGSMLRAGVPMLEAVEQILAATAARCQNDPAKELWPKRLMELASWYLTKFPEFLCNLDGELPKTWHQKLSEGRRPAVIYKRTVQGNSIEVRSFGIRQADEAASASQEPPKQEQQEQQQQKDARQQSRPRIHPKPFACFDFTQIPEREWLYSRHYMRGIASATISPGGGGKTTLLLVDAIAMATGLALLGEQPEEQLKVWYHNGEDPPDELDRRIAAVCTHYKIDPHVLDGRLFVTSGLVMPIKIASASSKEARIDHSVITDIAGGIRQDGVDVLVLDPLITLHTLAEAENHMMDPIIRKFATIGNELRCSIELAHHTRKKMNGQDEYTTADARGASAIIDAVRSARVLNSLTSKDAKLLGVEDDIEQLDYFRLDKGKVNMTRKGVPSAYFKFVSVPLPNGPGGTEGDDVGTIMRIVPADASVELTQGDIAFLLAEVGNNDCAERSDLENWFGYTVAKHFGFDLKDYVGRLKTEAVIDTLKRRKLIKIEKRKLRNAKHGDRQPRNLYAAA
jgi:hypothetical protein